MKKTLLIVIALFSSFIINAQDVLIMQNGEEIETKIIEVNQSQVKYTLYGDSEGSTYIVNRADVFKIKYASGSETVLNEHKIIEETEVCLPSKRRIGLAVRPEISGVLITKNGIAEATKSADFSVSVVYQFKKTFSLGAGTAYDITSDAGSFIPIYLNLRGYFRNRLSSPYYDFRIGYAISTSEYKKEFETTYIASKIERVYFRAGVGMDFYNFSLGIHVGLCENHIGEYNKLTTEEGLGGNYQKDNVQELNNVFIGLNFGYSIQCSRKSQKK